MLNAVSTVELYVAKIVWVNVVLIVHLHAAILVSALALENVIRHV